jgi:hypothetical protein
VEERARSFDLALATDEHRGLHREVVPNAAERAQGEKLAGRPGDSSWKIRSANGRLD